MQGQRPKTANSNLLIPIVKLKSATWPLLLSSISLFLHFDYTSPIPSELKYSCRLQHYQFLFFFIAALSLLCTNSVYQEANIYYSICYYYYKGNTVLWCEREYQADSHLFFQNYPFNWLKKLPRRTTKMHPHIRYHWILIKIEDFPLLHRLAHASCVPGHLVYYNGNTFLSM